MKITRRSALSGITRTLDLNITTEQIRAYESGELLQNAFPQLNVDDREWFKTGITGEEWDATFGGEEE